MSSNAAQIHGLHTHNPNLSTTTSLDLEDKYKGNKRHSQEPTGTHDTPSLSEEERRSQFYHSLVCAQRRYAEKLSIPTGSDYRFTKQEWDSLGEKLDIKDWDGGFVENQSHILIKKENLSSSWKGKENAVEESQPEN